ncbi:MAG: hypothetical protein ACPGVB_01140 [Chitinophagales bacterium]
MKTLLKMTFVLFALFASMKTQAQSLVGLWSEPTFQMQLQLNADGSYQLQYAQGNSYGQYALQGSTMTAEEITADMNKGLKRWADEKGMTIEEYKEYQRGFNATLPILERSYMQTDAMMSNIIN